MNTLPVEFSDLLSDTGQRLLAGDRSLVPCELTDPDENFFILPNMFSDPGLARVFEVFERDFLPRLGTIEAGLERKWLTGMTQNYRETMGKVMHVRSLIFGDSGSEHGRIAEENGFLAMCASESLRCFAEVVTGYQLEGGYGTQLSMNQPGHYVGPHNDHHPEFDWARDGYIDIQFIFSNDAVGHQWFVHQRGAHLSQIWDLNQRGGISVFRQPFWHLTTPMVAKPGREHEAQRWLVGQVFRILGRRDGKPVEAPSTLTGAYAKPASRPAPASAALPLPSFQLEGPRRLSQSHLWQLQRDFFNEHGVRAWSEEIVPSQITTSVALANLYAELIERFAGDLEQRGLLDREQPLPIFELGAGSGRLAFFVVKRLLDTNRHDAPKGLRFRYVMTDFTDAIVRAWQTDATLLPFIEAGNLELARFDADAPNELVRVSGEPILDQFANPGVVLANYFFDSIAADLFKVEEGRLLEGLVALHAPEGGPVSIEKVIPQIEFRPAAEPYYSDRELDGLLAQYQGLAPSSPFTLPVRAVRALSALAKRVGGQLLVLLADKGYAHPEELEDARACDYSKHGSLSFMANLHALGLYARDTGGAASFSPGRNAQLTFGLLSVGTPAEWIPSTWGTFESAMRLRNPLDQHLRLEASLGGQLGLSDMLAVLRASDADPWFFARLSRELAIVIAESPASVGEEVLAELRRVVDHHFRTTDACDVCFDVGLLCQLLGHPEEAIRFYERSSRDFGASPATLHNIGVCYYQMNCNRQALEMFENVLRLDARHVQAVRFRERVSALLEAVPA